ncbi:uncharacterized protein SPPG_00188 [Spizellomyces punctatus DAOM BR117]|uniref:Zinc finger CCCH domain-containing protein 15 n=1 Tax=Spizellomyces punctatus (strain DAOM BR117) TaxID=645134 RepID=A0A0L0HUA9_SPIPD|nr:uncharacterized protein SPPG_00188 [Spizellomyces punctatus DAOM BR117]KND04459.1 hypothetical protein SPPG_00188 [Spizellomyces punctatus DAOM BR117]|eukprot:XP_016612498.1 hypothetical protein SPPG_00188 [Spizellomyces punctatus DAOM BR117]
MPPKKAPKAEQKAKQKSVEDKTFGLKNKNKSAKVNRYVQQVQQQASSAGNRKDKKEAEARKATVADKKAAEAAKKAELAELFKPVQIQQKVPFGVDPKTIVCAFFKAGQCQKGTRCKFSHDLDVERKAAKADIYTDARDKEDDTMDNWDQAKLEDAVNQKHGGTDNLNKPTDIVCKFFLEAIESRKYGWFWECPNGGKQCKYRHALPPGFVLKKKETPEERAAREEAERENQISIEDFLETERHKLGTNLTPVTAESFAAWKADRKAREKAEAEAQSKKKKDAYDKYKAGMKSGMTFSGRELFDFNPEWAIGDQDDEDGAMEEYLRDDSGDEGEIPPTNGAPNGSQGPSTESKEGEALSSKTNGVDVAEDLFEGEDLEGLDDDGDDD